LAGGLLAATSLLLLAFAPPSRSVSLLEGLLLAAAAMLFALGFSRGAGVVSRVSTGVCLSIVTFFILFGAAEAFFRIIRFDFAREAEATAAAPPFFRKPMTPTGTVFFRHFGPERWTGQVLKTHLTQLGVEPNPYGSEPVVTVEYDRHGFRNPDGISDWDIAIAGDSFTELGYLPHDQLFTTIVAETLHVPVLNLGTCYTGPLTQLSYLQDYGIAASTKQTVIVFFEGNDLYDLEDDFNALARWRSTGRREYREFSRQTSFAKTMFERVIRFRDLVARRGAPEYVTAYFESPDGDVPVTLIYTPLARADLAGSRSEQLDYFFRQYREFGERKRVRVWLAYMPAKERVLAERMRFAPGAPARIRDWRPTDLPDAIAELCARYGVGFVDLTGPLVAETARTRRLLYNSIYDTHLNAKGSAVVARELARALGEPATDPRARTACR
jgi:hypothetical protein